MTSEDRYLVAHQTRDHEPTDYENLLAEGLERAYGRGIQELSEIVKDLNTKERVTFLLAEQNTNMALKYADYGYIMESGRVVMDGAATDLANNEDVKEFYLGVGGGERKSFKDVKSYKRRKRWLA